MKFYKLSGIGYPVKIHKFYILLFALCFYNIAYGQNQPITVSMKNQPLLKVFEIIEDQTDFSIAYNQTKLDVKQKVSANFVREAVSSVLSSVLKGTGFTYRQEGKHIIIIPVPAKAEAAPNNTTSTQQSIKIRGTVTDAQGEPLIGANVLVDGSKQATITDMNGEFSLEVPANSKLRVTYIGYVTQEVTVKNKTLFNIQLQEDTQTMDEVVVIGFGTQKKVNMTGAVASVNIKESLGDRPITNVSAALQGVVPGLKIESTTGTPGDDMTYNIRGTTSINGGEPLVLVNNVPMDINMIDPQDIESVSILKDAASAAIYGARAAFGVILITTKQGKKDMAPRFNYNNNFSFSKASELPQKASPLESVLAYKEMGWANDTYVDGKNITQWEGYIRDYQANPSNYPNGYIFDDQGNLFLMRENDMFADMMDNFGFMQNHSFSVSGGSQRTSYRLSLGYTGEDGILVTDKDKFDRINMSSFLSVDVNKWLTTQLDIRYANSTQNKVEQGGRNGVWGSAMHLPSYHNILPYEQDGIEYPAETSATFVRYGEPRVIKKTNLRTLGRVIISPLKGLKITGEYTYNRITEYNRMYVNKYKYIGFNFTGLLNNVENSRYALTQGFTNYNAINAFANYDFSIGKHDISIMGGYNQEESHKESQWSQRTDVLLENLPSLSGSTGTASVTDSFDEYAIRGLFYRVNYTYDGKYMFEANGRYDGTSRFPKDSRFGFFPSFSAGWRISEEPFYGALKNTVDNLKLRLSYGTLGNQQVGYYDYLQQIETGKVLNYSFGDKEKASYAYETAPNASDLTWETVVTKNIGLDIGIFNNRLNISADAYIRDTKDMLMPGKALPSVYGAKSPNMNAADLRTKGWELVVAWNDRFNVMDKPFNYGVSFGIGDNVSKITKYDNPNKEISSPYVGQRLGDIWGYMVDGYFATDEEAANYGVDQSVVNYIINNAVVDRGLHAGDMKYLDLDGNNKIEQTVSANDIKDQRIIGNSLPRYTYSIRLNAEWNGIDFSVFFQGVGKQDWYPSSDAFAFWGPYSSPAPSFIPKDFLADVWSVDNPDAYFPRPRGYIAWTDGRSLSSVNNRYLQSLAYCRLKNLTVGYTLPVKWLSKIHVQKARLYFSGENLLTLDRLDTDYIDPEAAAAGTNWKTGKTNALSYPFSKTYSFGIDITF